jgi:proline dehydrogenase
LTRIFKDSLQKLEHWAGINPVKLVRGAYLYREPAEKVAHSKQEADENYDNAVRHIITKGSNSVILATHNYHSIVKAVQLLQQGRVAVGSHPRTICFGQLYGMRDDITYGLTRELSNISLPPAIRVAVVKYVPYGGLHDVMPYLVRRAEENRGMLRGSILEREALYDEVKRRILRHFGLGLNRR